MVQLMRSNTRCFYIPPVPLGACYSIRLETQIHFSILWSPCGCLLAEMM